MCDFCEGKKSRNGVWLYSFIPFPSINLTTGQESDSADVPYHALLWKDEYGEETEFPVNFCPLCGTYLPPEYDKQEELIDKLKKYGRR